MDTESLAWRTRTWGTRGWWWGLPLHSDQGLWNHLDLFMPLNRWCCFHNPDCPVGESSLGHLSASLAHGSAEGEWVHKAELPWKCLPLLEGLIELGTPCRPALAICLLNTCHRSLMQSLCCQQESTLGGQGPLPSVNLFGHLDNGVISDTYDGPQGGVFGGSLFGFLFLGSLGAPSMLFLLNGGHIVDQMLQ